MTIDKISMVRVLSGNDRLDDDALTVYLDLAEQKILNKLYPYAGDDDEMTLPKKYDALQCQIAAYMINRRGSEGETANIEVGTERDFASADVPDDMLSGIVPMVGVPK